MLTPDNAMRVVDSIGHEEPEHIRVQMDATFLLPKGSRIGGESGLCLADGTELIAELVLFRRVDGERFGEVVRYECYPGTRTLWHYDAKQIKRRAAKRKKRREERARMEARFADAAAGC